MKQISSCNQSILFGMLRKPKTTCQFREGFWFEKGRLHEFKLYTPENYKLRPHFVKAHSESQNSILFVDDIVKGVIIQLRRKLKGGLKKTILILQFWAVISIVCLKNDFCS